MRGAESIAELLAWADWRFQWIHPFKDFNGRVGLILLIALAYKFALPPIEPLPTNLARLPISRHCVPPTRAILFR